MNTHRNPPSGLGLIALASGSSFSFIVCGLMEALGKSGTPLAIGIQLLLLGISVVLIWAVTKLKLEGTFRAALALGTLIAALIGLAVQLLLLNMALAM